MKLAWWAFGFAGLQVVSGAQPCVAHPSGVAAKDELVATRFAQAIDSGTARDPQSPDTLNSRVEFADFLAKASGGDCGRRLDNAQQQLEIAQVNHAEIALPSALARSASVEYEIHSARAACDDGPGVQDRELRAAVESASRAVDLYRDQFDAVAMVTMQFNVGVAYRNLGEVVAAIAALRVAIQMDREYGFGDDARDNCRLLLEWTGQPAGSDDVAALMKDFPQRTTTLSFDWFDGDADLTTTLEYQQQSEAGMLRMNGLKRATRRVQRRSNGWRVSFEPIATRYDVKEWPSDRTLAQGIIAVLSQMLVQFTDFDLGSNGNFAQSQGARQFDSSMRADIEAVSKSLSDNGVNSNLNQHRYAELAKYGDSIKAQVAEVYNIGTGAWNGASLDQGVWYDMIAPLAVPTTGLFVTHKIEFAFTRRVRCTASSSDEACVEIVLRATPDADALNELLMSLSHELPLDHKDTLELASSMSVRLVTDPKTLQLYESDVLRYVHLQTSGTFGHPMLVYERTHAVLGAIAGKH